MIEIIIIIIVVIADALRDSWWNKTNFWQCHIPKWIAFYTPLIYILWKLGLQWYWIIPFALFCYFLWTWIARKAGMPNAGSLYRVHLPALLKKLWNLIKGDKNG